MKTKYPNLYEFFAGYFHQDWPVESPTAIDVVKRYLSEFPRGEINNTLIELRELLTNTLSEADLTETVSQLGSYYNPHVDNLTYREWLLQICALFERYIL